MAAGVAQEYKFQKLLIEIARELDNDEVESMSWLCGENFVYTIRDPEQNASALLKTLKEKSKICVEDCRYLKRLLKTIHRDKLAETISEPEAASSSIEKICDFRVLLYEISLQLTDQQVESLRSLSSLSSSDQTKSSLSLFSQLMQKFGNDKDVVAELLIRNLKDINKKNLAERIEYVVSSQENLSDSNGASERVKGFQHPIPEWRLNSLLLDISRELDEKSLEELKYLCSGKGAIGEGEQSRILTPIDLFKKLRCRLMISEDNLLLLQAMLTRIGRFALNQKIFQYASERPNILHVFKPEKNGNAYNNGLRHYQFHVKGDIQKYSRGEFEKFRRYVAECVSCDPMSIFLVGVDDSGSIILTFLIHKDYGDKLEKIFLQNPGGFTEHNVDGFHIGISNPFDLSKFITVDSSSNEERNVKDDGQEIEGKPLSVGSSSITEIGEKIVRKKSKQEFSYDYPSKLHIQELLPHKLAQDEQLLKTVERQVSPHYLKATSQSHPWVFSAFAELIDNAYDPDVRACELCIDKVEINRHVCVQFIDDGSGMDREKLHKMLSFGFCDKEIYENKRGSRPPIGHYGSGFKSGSMRIGMDVIIFTKTNKSAAIGFLSQSFLSGTGAQTVLSPILEYKLAKLTRQEDPQTESNLDTMLKYSVFSSEDELKAQLKEIKKTGTRIIIFNLYRTFGGVFELDFESDPKDIRCPEPHKADLSSQKRPIQDCVSKYRVSLREYCSILYLKPRMRIILRGSKVHVKYVSKTLRKPGKYLCKPSWLESPIDITFGYFPNGETNQEDYGLMLYNRNRLILAFEKVGYQHKDNNQGVGVVGVAEVNCLTPIYNKQGFDKNEKYNSLMKAFASKLNTYWTEIEGGGELTQESQSDEMETMAMCDRCFKWRRLPQVITSDMLPERWYCHQNTDHIYNRCDIPEEPEFSEEGRQKSTKKRSCRINQGESDEEDQPLAKLSRGKARLLKHLQATKGFQATTSGLASFVKGKTPTSSKHLGYPSVRLKYSFKTGDPIYLRTHDILYLPGGLILISDELPKSCLKLFDMEGNLLQEYETYGRCCLAGLGEERVACLNKYERVTILRVSRSCIKKESECKTYHGYKCITALDSNTLAAFHHRDLDIISLSGAILRSFGTSENVWRACVSKDGSLVCAYLSGILKIDPTNGAELHKTDLKSHEPYPDPVVDVATTGDNLIVVLTMRGIDLCDAQCDRVKKRLWFPDDPSWNSKISAYDDVIVCCTDRTVYILELTY